jgi:hypothetical protein
VGALEIISKAVLSFCELAEAEGRTLREKSVVVIEGALMMLLGVSLLFLAVLAAGVALFMWLRFYICAPAAAAIVAALFAVVGIVLLCKGRSVSKDGGGPAE